MPLAVTGTYFFISEVQLLLPSLFHYTVLYTKTLPIFSYMHILVTESISWETQPKAYVHWKYPGDF